MKHLKTFEGLFSRDNQEELQSKFEILLDSIVEVMDKYGFKEYEEEDDWDPPTDEPYYEYSYNRDGTIRQINVSNISYSGYEQQEVLYALLQIKPKLELRTGFDLTIRLSEAEDSITIFPNLPKN